MLRSAGIQVRSRTGVRIPKKIAQGLCTGANLVHDGLQRIEIRCVDSPSLPAARQQPKNSAIYRHGNDWSSPNNLARNKASVAAMFKEEDKYPGAISGKVPLKRIQNRLMDALSDQDIPTDHVVSLMYIGLTGIALE